MKNLKANFYITLTFLLMETIIYAADPPTPTTADDDPPPRDLPIDQNIKILVIIAILYGTYKIYKHIQNKKASI